MPLKFTLRPGEKVIVNGAVIGRGEEAGSVMRKLADAYQHQGEYAKALEVNKQLLAMGGTAAKQGEEQRFAIMVDSLNISPRMWPTLPLPHEA